MEQNNNNNNFPFLIQLLGSLILAFNNVRLDQEMRTTRSDMNTDRRFAEAVASEQNLGIRETRSNLRELRNNVQTTGRVSAISSGGTMVLGGIAAVLLLLRGNSQKQQMDSQNDQIAELRTSVTNAQKQMTEHKTTVDTQLQTMNNEQTELKNKVEAQQAQEAEQTVESDQNASMSASPSIRVNVGAGAQVSASTDRRTDGRTDDLEKEIRDGMNCRISQVEGRINKVENTVEKIRGDLLNQLQEQDKNLKKVTTRMASLVPRSKGGFSSTSSSVNSKRSSAALSAVSGRSINKPVDFQKKSGSPPETCKPDRFFNPNSKDDHDDGGNIGENNPNIEVSYVLINNTTSSFNQIKYNFIKSHSLVINKEMNYIKNNSPIINKDMGCIKNTSFIIDRDTYSIDNKLNKDILFNKININKKGLIKSTYYYLDKKPSLNEESVLNTKISSYNNFHMKKSKNNHNLDYDYNNNLDHDYNNNLDYDYNHNLDYYYNHNYSTKPNYYLDNGDINWSSYFNQINKKTSLIYTKPLVAKIIQPLYKTKYQVLEKQILVVSTKQEILFYPLTPVIELLEFCALNTNNPIFVGLFIPVMGCLYIFELGVLLIINFTTIYLLHKSLLIFFNSVSQFIFNKDIKNHLNKTTNYFSNLIFLYLIFNAFYFLNFWLFFKISSLVFMKNLIKNKISIGHCYTKYIDINR